MRTLTFSALSLSAALATTSALADDTANYATAGVILSVPLGGTLDQMGLGVEASVMHYPDDDRLIGGGGFVQAQYLFGGGWRLDGGFQSGAYVAGAELGVALLSSRGGDVQFGLHLAPYLSIGFVSAALRWTPLLTGGGRGLELTGAAKLWVEFDGNRVRDPYQAGCFFGCSVPGRPLVVEGRAAFAAPVEADAWCPDDVATEDALSDAERAAVADEWTRAMLGEHASVAAFARLSLQLMALGAPPELLERAHRAALDEVDHTRRCAALATRFARRPVAPGPLSDACAPVALVDLATLAADTLREGCLNEAAAAEDAARALRAATDRGVREALAVIARDEAEHARLAWDIVDWCASVGGEAVRDALDEATRALPEVPARSVAAGAATLTAWGCLDARTKARSYAHRRREVMRRTQRVPGSRGRHEVVEASA